MIANGELPTTTGILYTAPAAFQGMPGSGSNVTVNFVRVVNNSGAARTFNLFLNVNGTAQPFIPIDTQLPIGAAYGDDIPPFQLPPNGTIQGDADAAGVAWTINVA